jgi:lipoate-protein ligase A
MIYYIESDSTDPYHNLSLEQFVFTSLNRNNSYFMLWRNHNTIVVGKHQNTLKEINSAFVKEKDIAVVRRLSGGGAVYHDLGNLNFTFITGADKQKGIDFSVFCEPIREALLSMGVPAEISGRNDMKVDGKKFSGNAQYIKEGRVMHHGTILYDSNLSVLSQALKPGDGKIESCGVKSIQSLVTNIRPYMKSDMGVGEFWAALREFMLSSFYMKELKLEAEQKLSVETLKDKIYSQWSWNYGTSPPYTLRKARRFEGCGRIEILLDIGKEGMINNAAFYGDFFGNREIDELVEALKDHRLEYEELKRALNGMDISSYFYGLNIETFLDLLFA